ncbi:deleted in malignant brain tumors 1 protein [Alligator mississippiensis]|uniref:deleted in malignant brain tumors 1 protein n=1 Tax=Alligator mississippiensis TaxID=8496 RepID=UPI0006EC70DD|nr:deleted in malignant brain tumors 1 protein [Alligator mississippiensis]
MGLPGCLLFMAGQCNYRSVAASAGARITRIPILLAWLWASLTGFLVAGNLELRLVNGPDRCTGRLEVLHDNIWGTVCDDGWDLAEAQVVCKELHCGMALSASGGAPYGQGSDPIWLDEVNCTGTEAALFKCKASPWGKNNCNHGEDAGVVCSGLPLSNVTELRLVNGPSPCAGRVEVLHDEQWGTVCNRSWDLSDAEVVCRELGCGKVLSIPAGSQYGEGSDHIWLDSVNCTGREAALSECRSKRWGDNSCSHGEDASMVCSEPTEIQLVNGPSRCAGRVEVHHNQQWGTVCDHNWDLNDAEVVCRQLGCGTAEFAPKAAYFGQSSNSIWLDGVNCMGTEAALSECSIKLWGNHSCYDGEEAGVVCSEPPPLRLVNGSSRCAGRVEVLHDQQWGSVCDNGWDTEDATVVCRQLGCGTVVSAPGSAWFGRGHDPIWLENVNCIGMEAALSECRAKPWGDHHCHHGEDAGVVCLGPTDLRLVGGYSRCSGRVEVLHNQQWGTVCNNMWDLMDAEVVCRQVGCGTPLAARFGEPVEKEPGPVWLDEVKCTGTEAALSGCSAKRWGVDYCHYEHAGVLCSEPTEVRLVDGPSHCAGRVEVLHKERWGSVCDDGWDFQDARVVCRQLGCGMPLSAPGKAHYGQGREPTWLDDVNCTGTENTLYDCRARPWGENNCNHREDASVICSDPMEVRLVNGSSFCNGRVEVLHAQQWGTVCAHGWDIRDVEVVCRQLGCGRPLSAPAVAEFGQGSGRTWVEDANCLGIESTLSECRVKLVGKSNCDHGEDASVVCSDPTPIRLVNGHHRCAGRVEVLHDQQWGTICDDDWGLLNARVVCRQLGCERALSAPGGAYFGQGSDPIWLDDVDCSGKETALFECTRKPWGEQNCDHREDASVVCKESPLLRLMNGSSRCSGRFEVFHNEQWGTVCDKTWDLQDAAVVCRDLGCGMVVSAPGSAYFGQGSDRIWLDDVNCTGTEAAFSECRVRLWGEKNCHHGEDAGVVCTDPVEIRLVNTSSHCAGTVEVFHDKEWGTVCDDDWDIHDANVVCRQLGCGTALAAIHAADFGRGSGPIWLDNVNCTGTEAKISKCGAVSWGEHNCHHREDAGVVCSEPAELRLVNGSHRCAGRVEVLHDQQWGTVCDDSWDLQDAGVVCRQLRCGTVLSAPGDAHFGHGHDPIWLDEVACTGTEAVLSECRAKPLGDHNCQHGEDASVVCLELPVVRLVNGSSDCAGRVEVFHGSLWGTVCDDGWDLNDADVVCRELGCRTAVLAPGYAHFGEGSGVIWLDRLNCTGKETSLSECGSKPWGEHFCYHREDASVVCSGPLELRLVNGSNRCAGRVEVLHNQKWGTVCDDNWDLLDAGVVCRQLGCGTPLLAPRGSHFGHGYDPIWLDEVSCIGTEAALTDCKFKPWGDHNCHHGKAASVVCSEPAELRLVNGSHRCAGRVEVLYDQQWGTVCDDSWDLQDAGVVCRQLGCGTVLLAPGDAHFGRGHDPIWLAEVNCTGTEAALSECRATPWRYHNCQHGKDASVVCSEPVPANSYLPLLLLGLAVGTVLLCAAVIFLRRRRKQQDGALGHFLDHVDLGELKTQQAIAQTPFQDTACVAKQEELPEDAGSDTTWLMREEAAL